MEIIGNILAQLSTPTPDDWRYWFGGRRSGGLGLDLQLLGLLATVVLIVWKFDEMKNWAMASAGAFSLALVIAFVWVGYHLPRMDAQAICFFLNLGQCAVWCCLMIHRQWKLMNWF